MWQVDRAQQSIIAPFAARLQRLLPGRHLMLATASGYGNPASHDKSSHSIAPMTSQTAGQVFMSGCAKAMSRIQAHVSVGQLRGGQALQAAGSAVAAGIGGIRWQSICTTAHSVLESALHRLRIRVWA